MVISIKNIKNSGTCFGSPIHHQANKKHSTGTFSECTRHGIPYCLQNYIDIKDHVLFLFNRLKDEIKFLYKKKDELNNDLYSIHLKAAQEWGSTWYVILDSIHDSINQELERSLKSI